MPGILRGPAPHGLPPKEGGATWPDFFGYSRSFGLDGDHGAGSTVFEGTAGRCTPRLK